MEIKERIAQANLQAVGKMMASDPVWVDVRPAIEVVPGMGKDKIFHAGPPISWERMCKPQQNAVAGAIIYEKLANSPGEAVQAVLEGRVSLDANHNHASVNPMTGVMSASMPVFVVEDRLHENRAFCVLYEGPFHRKLAMGAFDSTVLKNLTWIEDTLATVLRGAVLQAKGIGLKPIMAKALTMGDDLHNRNLAATCLLVRHVSPFMVQAGVSAKQLSEVLQFLEQSDNFFLSLAMPAAKVAADAAHDIECSTLVTAMTRNGVDFGVRVSGLGSQWFTGPAQPVEGLYFPGYSAKDAGNDIGDSTIMETVGLGGFAMAASPEMAIAAGGTPEQGIEWSKQMKHITITTNKGIRLPWVDFVGTPTGIDVRKVVESKVLPVINTAIAHREGGFIGTGMVKPPMECFKKAVKGIAKAVGL
jgi:hypothetical protein